MKAILTQVIHNDIYFHLRLSYLHFHFMYDVDNFWIEGAVNTQQILYSKQTKQCCIHNVDKFDKLNMRYCLFEVTNKGIAVSLHTIDVLWELWFITYKVKNWYISGIVLAGREISLDISRQYPHDTKTTLYFYTNVIFMKQH